jgi:hypothetical protein
MTFANIALAGLYVSIKPLPAKPKFLPKFFGSRRASGGHGAPPAIVYIERVPLTRRKGRLYLKGVKVAASTETDNVLGQHYPPDEWRKALFAAMPVLARTQVAWSDENHRHEQRAVYGYTGYWAPPWKTLRIHRCAECETAWYVALAMRSRRPSAVPTM